MPYCRLLVLAGDASSIAPEHFSSNQPILRSFKEALLPLRRTTLGTSREGRFGKCYSDDKWLYFGGFND